MLVQHVPNVLQWGLSILDISDKQVLRVLGVEHASLDDMLCQVSAHLAC